MSTIYGIVGQSVVCRVDAGLEPGDGFIEMTSDRPAPSWIAYLPEGASVGIWVEPNPIPTVCSGSQGQLALIALGLYQAARDYIDAITDPTEKLRAEIEWARPTWTSDSAFLRDTWAALGGTQAQLESAFRLAVTL